MNIIALNSSKNWGGNERWLTSALNGLSRRGHQIHLIKRNKTDHWNGLSSSIETIDAPFTNELSIKTKAIIQNLIKKCNSDILLSTKRKDYVIGAQVKNKANISHVMRLGISRPILKRDIIQRYIISKRVDGIIVNAQSLKSELFNYSFIKNNFNSDKIKCIYNGYDILEGKPTNFNKIKSTLLIRCAGRLTVHKGYDILLSSLNKIKDLNTKYLLEIAGEGPEQKRLEALIKEYNLEPRCKLVGEKKDIVSFFNEADLVVIPSRSEGIPNTLFEAWMVKKPVIATNAGGISEVVDNMKDGIVCEPHSEDLMNVLKNYINNIDDFKEMGLKGYNKLIQSFSMEKMISSLEVYLKGLSG